MAWMARFYLFIIWLPTVLSKNCPCYFNLILRYRINKNAQFWVIFASFCVIYRRKLVAISILRTCARVNVHIICICELWDSINSGYWSASLLKWRRINVSNSVSLWYVYMERLTGKIVLEAYIDTLNIGFFTIVVVDGLVRKYMQNKPQYISRARKACVCMYRRHMLAFLETAQFRLSKIFSAKLKIF